MRTAGVIVVAGAALAALAGAYALGRTSDHTVAAAASPAAPVDLQPMQRDLDAVLASQAELRAEVAALRVTAPHAAGEPPAPAFASASPAPAPAPSPAPRTTEAVAAEDAAHAILDDALRAGRWTNDDRQRMREALESGDDATRQAIFREFSVAVNEKRLALDGLRGPPL